MRYFLADPSGAPLAGNITTACSSCLASSARSSSTTCPNDGTSCRIGKCSNQGGGTVFLCSNAHDDLASSRIFKNKLVAYLTVLPSLVATRNQLASNLHRRNRQLTHNLVSLNARSIQELYAFIPQDTMIGNVHQQIRVLSDLISSDSTQAAKLFLRLAKNSLAMKGVFSVFRRLDNPSASLTISPHDIRRVVLNVLHVFFADFTDRDIRVRVEDSTLKVRFDYETFHVALYHIIDNAAKYAMPHSELSVCFLADNGHVDVSFEMMSIRIRPDEVPRITDEGFRGEEAKAIQAAGDGIGLHSASQLLTLNNARLLITPNLTGRATDLNGHCFESNRFSVRLPIR